MSGQESRIQLAVDEHYATIAREFDPSAGATCCCGPSLGDDCCCGSADLYEGGLLADLPLDVTGLSLGCGDPVTIASLRSGETVVDLGSGGGIDCFLAARQVGPEGAVIGVDATAEMLEKANANKRKLNTDNVEFRQGRIEDLPVPDDSVDVVMSNCVINLSPDKDAVFREAYRVLRPGGRISVSDIVTEGSFSAEMRAESDLWSACISGAVDVVEYLDMMRQAGFVDVRVQEQVETPMHPERQAEMPRVYSARITARKQTISE